MLRITAGIKKFVGMLSCFYGTYLTHFQYSFQNHTVNSNQDLDWKKLLEHHLLEKNNGMTLLMRLYGLLKYILCRCIEVLIDISLFFDFRHILWKVSRREVQTTGPLKQSHTSFVWILKQWLFYIIRNIINQITDLWIHTL